MRLLCVNNRGYINTRMPKPVVGEEYTGIDEEINEGMEYWLIQEFSTQTLRTWYRKENFIPLDGPNEKEYSEGVLNNISQPENA